MCKAHTKKRLFTAQEVNVQTYPLKVAIWFAGSVERTGLSMWRGIWIDILMPLSLFSIALHICKDFSMTGLHEMVVHWFDHLVVLQSHNFVTYRCQGQIFDPQRFLTKI